jgi:hypothetical protein
MGATNVLGSEGDQPTKRYFYWELWSILEKSMMGQSKILITPKKKLIKTLGVFATN